MNKLRTEFTNLPARIDWFPGHMRKAVRQLENHWGKIDVFVEVRDARLPRTSENPELLATLPHNLKRLVVYNKLDLVPARKAQDLMKSLHEKSDVPYLALSTKQNVNVGKLITFITKNA